MTEWNASEYDRIAALQAAMAEEALSLLDLRGTETVLDIGCGNGRTTGEIAAAFLADASSESTLQQG